MAKWHADHMCVIYFKRNKTRRVEKNLSFYQLKFNVCVHCIWRPLGQYILTYIYLDVVFFMLKKNSKFWRLKQNKKKRTEEIRMNEDIVTQMIYMLQCFIWTVLLYEQIQKIVSWNDHISSRYTVKNYYACIDILIEWFILFRVM